MNKNFYELIKKNKKIIFKKKTDKNILIVDRQRFETALFQILIAASLNKKYSLNVKVLTSKNKFSNFVKLYKSFGLDDFIYSFKFKYTINGFLIIILSAIYFLKNFLPLFFKSFDWFIDNFSIKGIKLGDLVYDTYIRKNHNFINPKKNFEFCKIIYTCIYKVLHIFSLVKKNKIKYLIVGTSNYANYDSLFLRVGLKLNIKILEPYFYKNKNGLLEYKKNNLIYGHKNIFFDNRQKTKFKNLNIEEKNLDKFIRSRFSNKLKLYHTNNLDIKLANKSKIYYTKDEFFNKFVKEKKFKRLVVFAPHAFSDAPHGTGYKLIFTDFYNYFTETIKVMSASKEEVLWIVRPHPLSKKYGESNIVENFLKKIEGKNIILCPKNITTKNLIKICDTVITMKGTIGLEFAASGKKPVTCGYPPYSNFGISFDLNSKKKYFSTINDICNKNLILSKNKTYLAKKMLYFMERKIPFKEINKSQFIQKRSIVNLSNKQINWKKLIVNFKNDINFKKDDFYRDCIKKL